MQGRACVKALCVVQELKAKGRDCICLQTSPPELASCWRASENATAQTNARHYSCNGCIYYSGYHSNETDILARGLRLSPKREDISQAPIPRSTRQPALFLPAARGQRGASLVARAGGGCPRASAAPVRSPPGAGGESPFLGESDAAGAQEATRRPQRPSSSRAVPSLHPPSPSRAPFYQIVRRVPSLPG